MSSHLEKLFNMADVREAVDSMAAPDEDSDHEIEPIDISVLRAVDKIDEALPAVRGLDAADGEMDELADTAMASYKDLMDLGMQVESRSAAEIFSVASGLLGHAITAKTAKINKKLKMLELQLKKAKLDSDLRERGGPEESDEPSSAGYVVDRNELIAALRKQLE